MRSHRQKQNAKIRAAKPKRCAPCEETVVDCAECHEAVTDCRDCPDDEAAPECEECPE